MSHIGIRPPNGAALVRRVGPEAAARINEIVNDPAVRPWLANDADGVIDMGVALAHPGNVMLLGEHGGCLFFWLGDCRFEVHTFVLPAGRGAWTRAMTEAAFWFMFTRTDCREVLTRVPGPHVAAKAATVAVGMHFQFTEPGGVIFRNRRADLDIYAITLEDWILGAPLLPEAGQWLHNRMAQEAKRLGLTDEPHEDSPAHNRFVGAAFEMARHGQLAKAVGTYNRWAVVVRHATIEIASNNPPAVKFDIGLLVIRGDDIEVVPT
jgi:hypothetical protein